MPDAEKFNVLDASRSPKLKDVALTRLHQCSCDRRYPTHLATIEIGLVNADDGDRSLCSPLMSVGDDRAKEHLVQVFLCPGSTTWAISSRLERKRIRRSISRRRRFP